MSKQTTCPECLGFGKITVAGCSGTYTEKCPLCGGTGARPIPHNSYLGKDCVTCPKCNGTGKIKEIIQ